MQHIAQHVAMINSGSTVVKVTSDGKRENVQQTDSNDLIYIYTYIYICIYIYIYVCICYWVSQTDSSDVCLCSEASTSEDPACFTRSGVGSFKLHVMRRAKRWNPLTNEIADAR